MKKFQIKNELTVPAVIELLNQEKYSLEQLKNCAPRKDELNGFKLDDWNSVITRLLDYFFEPYKIKKVKEDFGYFGGSVLLDPRNTGYWFKDLYQITFNLLYPSVISLLNDKGKIKFNIEEFGVLYKFLVKNHKSIKNSSELTEEGKFLFKVIINYTYGACTNYFGRGKIKAENIDIVPTYTKEIFELLFKENPKNILYIDTDVIYLRTLTVDILEKLDSLKVNYDVKGHIQAFFIMKKKYILVEDGVIKLKGIKTITSKTLDPIWQMNQNF
jgi:hypothetical protein